MDRSRIKFRRNQLSWRASLALVAMAGPACLAQTAQPPQPEPQQSASQQSAAQQTDIAKELDAMKRRIEQLETELKAKNATVTAAAPMATPAAAPVAQPADSFTPAAELKALPASFGGMGTPRAAGTLMPGMLDPTLDASPAVAQDTQAPAQ